MMRYKLCIINCTVAHAYTLYTMNICTLLVHILHSLRFKLCSSSVTVEYKLQILFYIIYAHLMFVVLVFSLYILMHHNTKANTLYVQTYLNKPDSNLNSHLFINCSDYYTLKKAKPKCLCIFSCAQV